MSDFELSAGEFRALYDRVKHMSLQGPADRRGALNNISSTEVVTAASGVWRGRAVSLGAPMESEVTPDNPDPVVHQMTHTGISSGPASGLSFAMDRVTLNIHGNADSHIDALCHVIFDGILYNDLSPGAVTAAGTTELSIEVAGSGIVGRGVLLDIPRVRGVPWLAPCARGVGCREFARRVASGGPRTPRGTADRGPWQRWLQRHGAECGRGCRLPGARARRQRDGPAPHGLAAIRRPRPGVRGAEPLVVPLRRRAAPAPRRNRL